MELANWQRAADRSYPPKRQRSEVSLLSPSSRDETAFRTQQLRTQRTAKWRERARSKGRCALCHSANPCHRASASGKTATSTLPRCRIRSAEFPSHAGTTFDQPTPELPHRTPPTERRIQRTEKPERVWLELRLPPIR